MPGTCTSIINLNFKDGSEGSPSNPAKFNGQDFKKLKEDFLRKGEQFEDSTFPPDKTSLGGSSGSEVKWLRPADIVKLPNQTKAEAVFCTEGATRFDFGQGALGNCWFVAAISSLTFREALMAQVVPMDQNFNNHAGIFHFRFWRFGKWVDVVIDDYLPVKKDKLLSVSDKKNGNEFWAPLMEKAYAKVCGTYTDMVSGQPSEAFRDLCGGLNMRFNLHVGCDEKKLWTMLSNASSCNSMICCGSKWGQTGAVPEDSSIGGGHAYSVTAVTEVNYESSTVKLVRVLNPYGNFEWTGNWSDKSDMWKKVSEKDRANYKVKIDGEFWIELEDFYRNFENLYICCENPNFIDGDVNCQWQSLTHHGKWTAGKSEGGDLSNPSFDPQYRQKVNIINASESKDINIVLRLMKNHGKVNRKERTIPGTVINVFKIPPGTTPDNLSTEDIKKLTKLNSTVKEDINIGELVEMYSMEPGEYLIVPSTKDPDQSADFLLTIFSKTDAQSP